jgi:hypothetical protein
MRTRNDELPRVVAGVAGIAEQWLLLLGLPSLAEPLLQALPGCETHMSSERVTIFVADGSAYIAEVLLRKEGSPVILLYFSSHSAHLLKHLGSHQRNIWLRVKHSNIERARFALDPCTWARRCFT